MVFAPQIAQNVSRTWYIVQRGEVEARGGPDKDCCERPAAAASAAKRGRADAGLARLP